MTIETSDVKAGGEFILNVTSTLNSTVSLLAIDQRALTQDDTFDISKSFILDRELAKYDLLSTDYDHEIPFWFYHQSYQKKFVDVGAVILTNAVQEIPCESSEPSVETSNDSTDSQSSATATQISCHQADHFKKKFVYESFLFKTIDVTTKVDTLEGTEVLHETAPDFPASWILSGVSLSSQFGLGLTTSPAVLSTFRHFYIDFITPKFIKLGEVVQLEILIVNLFDVSLNAAVKFKNEMKHFEFVRPFAYNWTTVADGQVQKIWIQSNSIYRLRIEIEPRKTGFIDLTVSTTSVKAGDTVERELLVVPEGFPIFENQAEFILVDECDKEGKQLTLSCSPPADVRSETVEVQASITGDVLGLALINVESLIRLPSGSGEQTMITFVPIVVALEYLTVTEKLTNALKETAIEYLELGYQRILKYRRSDGSFSAFGETDSTGSNWLTAYAAKYLRRAQKFINIENNVIDQAFQFVLSKQNENGEFREDGAVLFKTLQSATGSGVAFTAFITAAVQDDLFWSPQFTENVQKGISFIKQNIDRDDVYSLALATNLLIQAEDESTAEYVEQLLTKAIRTSDFIYWKNTQDSSVITSLDIEISAYALLVINQISELNQNGFKVFRWLISQQNSHGGFQSAQDTVIALEAISIFAEKISTSTTDLEVELNPEYGMQIRTNIDSNTSLRTQIFQLESSVRKLFVNTTGKGFAVVQLSCNYYVNSSESSSSFDLSVKFANQSCDNRLVMIVSASLKPETAENASNIAVIKIDFPSGFSFDADTPLAPEIQVNF